MRKDTLLIVDEDENNLEHIINCVGNEYKILEASDGKEAIETLLKHKEYICALIINFSISELEQNTILSKIQQNNELMRIPVIIITDENQYERENMALQSGAWDFIRKPFDKEVMDLRLKNVIIRSNLNELQKLMYLEEFDKLTGIYNKNKFFKVTKKMIHNNKKGVYAFIHFDIDRFQSINSFLGKNEGDNLLKYIADYFTDTSKNFKEYTYGRIEADIFCMCISYEKEKLSSWLQNVRTKLTQYNLNFDIVPSIGIYIIEDNMLSIDRIYDRSTLAAKNSKNSYVNYYTFYDENMSKQIEKEQEIVNDMNTALNERQFSVYYQPKYDIKSNTLSGAEALVRWIHPIKGIVSPGEFIPIFEKNGFITKLDYYVWEEVCRQLRGWLDEGKKVYPISINVSRINLYNPRLVEMIIELTNKYNIPTNLFNLELTESAYIDNPLIMINSMMELQKKGFVILMDDFGSGYSSLSVLKDIAVDIIKIDMRFFSKTKIDGRGENIIASVIRMAKWLHIPVVAEGVETKEQVEFLRGIGCEYVQGFYYARPMPYDKYEELMDKGEALVDNDKNSSDNMDIDFLWSVSPQMEMLFNNAIQAVVICEFEDNHISILRVNKVYYEMMGYDENIFELDNAYNSIEKKYINDVLNAFNEAVNSKNTANCDYVHENKDGSYSWINMKVKYVNKVGDKSILCAVLIDITEQKKFEKEIQKYRSELLDDEENKKTMLIVDDVAQKRAILTEIFKNKFNIIEVENGLEAKNIIEKNPQCINIILLDLLMPVMDGKEFLAYKKSKKDIESIPVIIITAEDNPDMQRKVIEIGANDYIIKPFIPEIVALRVENVMQSAKSTKLMQEYKNDDIHRKVNFK